MNFALEALLLPDFSALLNVSAVIAELILADSVLVKEGADILREIADDPARAAAFRAVYPAAGSGQAYRVELVNAANGERRTVLITVDGNGVFTVGRP